MTGASDRPGGGVPSAAPAAPASPDTSLQGEATLSVDAGSAAAVTSSSTHPPEPPTAPSGRREWLRDPLMLLFTAAILLNALLLFLVQPMFGKMVLPRVGGTPAVWNTCLLFFQAALLAGYLYAHVVARRLATRAVVIVHLALLVLAALTLPIGIPAGATPDVDSPTLWLLGTLTIAIGLPFVVLAAGSPLLQHLFARSGHASRHDPYFLYAASNIGSFGALLVYPLLMEPTLALGTQSVVWTVVFVCLTVLVGVAGFAAVRSGRGVVVTPAAGAGSSTAASPADASSSTAASPADTRPDTAGVPDETPAPERSRRAERMWWLLLSFVPNSLLLGITAYITTDIAAAPLLWVLPLGLYLLSFVLAFGARRAFWAGWAARLAPVGFLAMAAPLFSGNSPRGLGLVAMPALSFFIIALYCHGRLYDSRPDASRLTEFYLLVSVGGVLGGAFNVLLAPLLFDIPMELPIALAIAAFLIPAEWRGFRDWHRYVLLAFGVMMVFAVLERDGTSWDNNKIAAVALLAAIGVGFIVARRQALLFGSLVTLVLVAAVARDLTTPGILFRERTFFGEHTVRQYRYGGETLNFFSHGRTLHGAQQRDMEWRSTPLTYYAPEGPLGELFFVMHQEAGAKNVGVLGLGVGTTAAYAREADTFTFFEIDPLVEEIARDTSLFTYLTDAAGTTEVVLGDARLTMSRQPDSRFDLLVVDAFSSDAIPVHLVTREAMEMYFSKLGPGGIAAFHVSNRYMDLAVMLQAISRDLGLVARERFDTAPHDPSAIARMRHLTSHWVVVARSEEDIERLNVAAWWPISVSESLRAWTDDFSNLVSVMRLGGWSRSRILAEDADGGEEGTGNRDWGLGTRD